MKTVCPLRGLAAILLLVLPALLPAAAQNKAEPQVLAVTNARLIDGSGAPPVDGAVILVTGDKFTAAGPASKVKVPAKARVVDARGRTVIPGMIDAHIHVSYPRKAEDFLTTDTAISAFRAADLLRSCLMDGITTVRDCMSWETVMIAARRAFEQGLLVGSRPIVSGQGITSTGGHGSEGYARGTTLQVDGADGFRRGVRTQLKAGADFIKVLCPFSREEILAAVQEAHAQERFITVHPSQFKAQYDFTRWTIEAGADCFEHAYMIPDELIPQIAAKDIACVPTVSILLILGEQYKKERGPEWAWKVEHYLGCEDIFKKLHRAGVRMAVGTDAVVDNMRYYPGLYFKETDQFVAWGCTPMETIVAATKIGAQVCAAADRLGTIEAGKLADLVILDRDPLADIANLRSASVVIQGGRIVKGADGI